MNFYFIFQYPKTAFHNIQTGDKQQYINKLARSFSLFFSFFSFFARAPNRKEK